MSGQYYGMDHDAYQHEVYEQCSSTEDDGRTYESQATYNPYEIHMGQMTVYR